MEYLPKVLIFVIAILVFFWLQLRRKPKRTSQKSKPQIIPEYDNEGYNQQGYNEVGRNRQGKYNRFYNVKWIPLLLKPTNLVKANYNL